MGLYGYGCEREGVKIFAQFKTYMKVNVSHTHIIYVFQDAVRKIYHSLVEENEEFEWNTE